MRFLISFGCVLFLSVSLNAQYWIGPKVGYHYTIHDYQDDLYLDNYKSEDNHNFEAGLVVTYTASDRYAVHGELFWEQIGNKVVNESGFTVVSTSQFNYLSAPILLRVSMGHTPVHWYLNAGPKVSLWLNGKGNIKYADDEAGGLDGIVDVDYKIVYSSGKAQGTEKFAYVDRANRIQYALTAGGGFYLDLANGARMMFDARYNWGHSNMGFNTDVNDARGALLVGSQIDIPRSGYQENYEYTHNTLSFSIAYMFEYNTQLKRKGGSTSKDSKNTKKSAKAKKKSSRK